MKGGEEGCVCNVYLEQTKGCLWLQVAYSRWVVIHPVGMRQGFCTFIVTYHLESEQTDFVSLTM